MLVLSRKLNETIAIGDDIKIQLIKIKGNVVRIGIEAPSDVKILRGELAPFGIVDRSHEPTVSNDDDTNRAVAGFSIDLDLESDDVNRLPNPFAVAHA